MMGQSFCSRFEVARLEGQGEMGETGETCETGENFGVFRGLRPAFNGTIEIQPTV
jgi:hypothetical protein